MGERFGLAQRLTQIERRHPEIIRAGRRRRIALGSGTSTAEVNRLLKQLGEMQRVMRQLGSRGPKAERELGRILGR